MDSKKRKDSMHEHDAKPRRSLRIQWLKNLSPHNNPYIPVDMMLNIISRLPLKYIIGCKSISHAFNHLISDPSFSHIYLTNKSDSFSTMFLNVTKIHLSFVLVEFDKRVVDNGKGNHKTSQVAKLNLKRHMGGSSTSIKGYCNGLFCLLKLELGLYRLFVTNPILGDFIQLPQPVANSQKIIVFAYGIGYCQFTNRYKVLRIITEYNGPSNYKNNTQIFTIGSDKNWRSVSDVNVPYNIRSGHYKPSVQVRVVPFRSALHWVVQPVSVSGGIKLKPHWGGAIYICASDMTGEKVAALPLPTEAIRRRFHGCHLTVLLDNLCVWQTRIDPVLCVDVYVMDEYGVEGSWTKQFVLNMSGLSTNRQFIYLFSVKVSPGVIMLSDFHKLFFYDMKKKRWLRVICQSKKYFCPIPFVPCFVSLRNMFPC